MAPKAKRGRKPKTQENVIDSTSEADAEVAVTNGAQKPLEEVSNPSAKSPKQTGKKKQATKRTARAASVEKEVVEEVPAKRGRGRAKAKEVESLPEPVPEPPKVAKGRRGATKKADLAEETPVVVEEPPKNNENGPAKRGKGRGKAAAAKEEPALPMEPAQQAEARGTKRGAAGSAKKGKTSKDASATNDAKTEVEKEVVEPPAPSKGRGRKVASSKEASSKEETTAPAVETKLTEKPKRGRKGKEAATAIPEETAKENGESEPTKKATKRAAPASSKTSSSPSAKTSKKRASPSKKVVEEQITDDRDDNVPVDGEFDDNQEEIITAKKTKTTAKKKTSAKSEVKSLPASIDYSTMNFSIDKDYNMKISSWNVAGLRAWLKKSGADYIRCEQPDIICLQEIKCIPEDIPDEARFAGYHPYWLCKPGGHAGVALYSKIMPINVEYGIGDSEQDDDGRILTAEFEKFFVICVYVPNAGRKLVTLPKRLRWNKLFEEYVQKLNAKKPVIICGDMNVAHNEIDLTNPKTNKNNAGFTQEERNGMTDLLNLGYVDTYRHFYPKQERAYTFWAYFMNSRAKDVGWRLDYFIVSERFLPKCVDNVIRSKVMGSDHCPITLFLNV